MFLIGLILLLVALVLVSQLPGPSELGRTTWWHAATVVLAIAGAVLLMASVAIVIWRNMP